jgi:hemerythrin-like domain-containing protein
MVVKTPERPDSRDMIVAHLFYRREIRALAGLVAAVEEGDRVRTGAVADHVGFVVDLVHGHHRAEDRLLWPKLLDRAPDAVKPIVSVMEFQHGALDLALQDLESTARRWRDTAGGAERDEIAELAAEVYARLAEHLDLEEENILSLIDEHLTFAEWAEVAAATGAPIPREKLPVVFGMALYDANPEMVRILRKPIPDEMWDAFAGNARQAYADYAQEIFGTPTPESLGR